MSRDLYYFMAEALKEAEKAFSLGEVPVGAVLTDADGSILARGHNQPISLMDPTAHAEVLVLRAAGPLLQNYRLLETTLICTIEPCAMCIGAAIHARVSRLVYGANDSKWGAAGSLYNLAADHRLNHHMDVIPGIMEEACRKLVQDFFYQRRGRACDTKRTCFGEVPKWS